ncbi:MAG: hypothetical protein ABSC07_04550 [Terriglobales bacterium]
MFSHKILILTIAVLMVAVAAAQQPPVNAQEPKVKVNVLNVCAPSADEQKELSSALAKVPGKPAFATDFEVSRGRSTLDPNTPIPGMQPLPAGAMSAADWVRIRREFPEAAVFSNVQYSFSVDSKNMTETLVLRVREQKDLIQVSIEDTASAVASAAAMLASTTPVSRVRLERFGKPSVALARCSGEDGTPVKDQSAYEPIFHAASSIMERYRDALGARKMVPEELARLGVATPPKASSGKKKSP